MRKAHCAGKFHICGAIVDILPALSNAIKVAFPLRLHYQGAPRSFMNTKVDHLTVFKIDPFYLRRETRYPSNKAHSVIDIVSGKPIYRNGQFLILIELIRGHIN